MTRGVLIHQRLSNEKSGWYRLGQEWFNLAQYWSLVVDGESCGDFGDMVVDSGGLLQVKLWLPVVRESTATVAQ